MSDRYLGIGFESTYNEAVAPTVFLDLLRYDARPVRQFVNVETIRSIPIRDIKEVTNMVEWEAEVHVNYQDIPLLFYALLGNSDDTGGGPYTHTLPGAGGIVARPTMTIDAKKDADNLCFRDIGSIAERLALAVVREDVARATIGGIAVRQVATGSYTGTATSADATGETLTDSAASFPLNAFKGWTLNNTTDGSSGTVTANTATTISASLSGGSGDDWGIGDAYTLTPPTDSYNDFDLSCNDATVNVDASDAEAHQFNLNINFPVDRPHKLGSKTFARQPEQSAVLEIEGDFVTFFEGLTHFANYDGSSDVDIQLNATDGTHSLTINLDKTRVIDHQAPISGRGRMLETVRFRAFNTGVIATNPVQVIGVNDQATVP